MVRRGRGEGRGREGGEDYRIREGGRGRLYALVEGGGERGDKMLS